MSRKYTITLFKDLQHYGVTITKTKKYSRALVIYNSLVNTGIYECIVLRCNDTVCKNVYSSSPRFIYQEVSK